MQNKQLKKLQQLWYKKLAKSGFKDVEAQDAYGDMRLKQLDSNQLRHAYRTSTEMQLQQRYYELARQFYNQHNFETGREKEIWRLHSEGCSISQINDTVKKTSWSSVQRVTQRLARIMLAQRVGDFDD